MLIAAHSDIGIKKSVNQDAVIVRAAKLSNGQLVTLAAICDGMGGLSNGEVASKEAVQTLDSWFTMELPTLLKNGITNNTLQSSLNSRILEIDKKLNAYGKAQGDCGTTLAGLFMYEGKIAVINVGDSRVYRIREKKIEQLTVDQTVIQKEIEAGRLTEEEAKTDPRRSVLLQCIGAGGDVVPVYTFGEYQRNDVFLLCSDGFRHKLTSEEILERLDPEQLSSEEEIKNRIIEAVEENKTRKEKDNISVIVIKL